MELNIALSTALSWNHNWDPIYSLGITENLNVKNCQVYIDINFSKETINKIKNFDLDIILHSPSCLNNHALNPKELEVISKLKSNEKVYVVYHHDYTTPVSEIISVTKELNKWGVVALLENFYQKKDQKSVIENIESYKEVLVESKKQGLQLHPLLDVPRLFIEDIYNGDLEPLKETFSILELIENLNHKLFLHLIDSNDTLQNREAWCVLGKGYIPYNKIFSKILESGIEILLTVLEFEEEKHVIGSIKYLEEMFANIHW